MSLNTSVTPDEWAAALRVLRLAADADAPLPDRAELERLIQPVARAARRRRRSAPPDANETARRQEQSRRDLAVSAAKDRKLRRGTAMQQLHLHGETAEGTGGTLAGKAASCHICGLPYREIDPHYHRLCPPCAQENRTRRAEHVDLSGRIALVTGGRIKIGFATALRLLRQGARVLVTTRFPHDAAHRFAREDDFAQWRDRLEIHGLDFLDPRTVLTFSSKLDASLPHLDILINNAAQTVKRPDTFYAPALAMQHAALPPGAASCLHTGDPLPSLSPSIPILTIALDRHGQPRDDRPANSWSLRLHDVPPGELLEVLLVNAAAPALLATALKPLLLRSPHPARFIVNATGMDGRFDAPGKSPRHPHVNMSKAALNMLTRTAAADYARDRIYMNSVDTGWISDESPVSAAGSRAARGWTPPLDEADAAARLCAPIADGMRGDLHRGHLFRHYRSSAW